MDETTYTTRAWYPGLRHEYTLFDPGKVHRMVSAIQSRLPGKDDVARRPGEIKESVIYLKQGRVPGER